MKLRRKALGLLLLVGMVGALLAATGTALGDHEPTESPLPDVGVLRLHMDEDGDYFRFDPHSESFETYKVGTTVQTIGLMQKCIVDPTTGPLVELAAEGSGKVGYNDHELGIWSGGSKGVPCGLTDLPEGYLEIALAGELADYEIDYFEVDFEGKFDVTVRAELYLGASATPVYSEDRVCGESSDCGSDSTDGDNTRWVVDPPGNIVFDRVQFSVAAPPDGPANGAFSLAGGHDGTSPGPLGSTLATDDTLFHITDVDTIVCDEDGEQFAEGETSYDVSAQLCIGKDAITVLFSVPSIDEVLLEILGDPDETTSVVLLEEITFPARPAPATAGQIPFTLFHDDIPPLDGGDAFETPRCLFNPDPDDDGVLASNAREAFPLNDETPSADDKHTTCFFQATFTQDEFGDWIASYKAINDSDGWRSGI